MSIDKITPRDAAEIVRLHADSRDRVAAAAATYLGGSVVHTDDGELAGVVYYDDASCAYWGVDHHRCLALLREVALDEDDAYSVWCGEIVPDDRLAPMERETFHAAEAAMTLVVETLRGRRRRISATVTPCHDPDVRSWPEYVAERLAARYPDHEVSVETGTSDYAELGRYLIGDFDQAVESWWDDLCRDPEHEQWSDGDSVEAQS